MFRFGSNATEHSVLFRSVLFCRIMTPLYYQMCKIISACAGKRWLLTCIQHIRTLIHVQHTKCYSCASYHRAVHELLVACSAWKLVRMQYMKFDSLAVHFVPHACFNSSYDKNWRTHMCSPHASVNLDVSCTVVQRCLMLVLASGWIFTLWLSLSLWV